MAAAKKRRIREDFVGTIHLPDTGQQLKAGDEVPEGVEIGDHAAEEVSAAELAKSKPDGDAA